VESSTFLANSIKEQKYRFSYLKRFDFIDLKLDFLIHKNTVSSFISAKL